MPPTFQPFNIANVRPNPLSNIFPLLTNAAWIKHANSTVSSDGLTLTLNATTISQNTYIDPTVLPNTQYQISIAGSANSRHAVTDIQGNVISGMYYAAPGTRQFDSGNRTTIRVYLSNDAGGAGTYLFSNAVLSLVQPTFSSVNTLDFFKEFVVNGDFSNGATGWTLINGSVVVGGILTYSPTAIWMETGRSSAPIAVTPNTDYQLKADTNGYYSLIDAVSGAGIVDYPSVNNKVDVTWNSGNRTSVKVGTSNGPRGAGTYTFDNISLRRVAP